MAEDGIEERGERSFVRLLAEIAERCTRTEHTLTEIRKEMETFRMTQQEQFDAETAQFQALADSLQTAFSAVSAELDSLKSQIAGLSAPLDTTKADAALAQLGSEVAAITGLAPTPPPA
jgi:predicted  nucleic acid-binding Zn-ribbon protein